MGGFYIFDKIISRRHPSFMNDRASPRLLLFSYHRFISRRFLTRTGASIDKRPQTNTAADDVPRGRGGGEGGDRLRTDHRSSPFPGICLSASSCFITAAAAALTASSIRSGNIIKRPMLYTQAEKKRVRIQMLYSIYVDFLRECITIYFAFKWMDWLID